MVLIDLWQFVQRNTISGKLSSWSARKTVVLLLPQAMNFPLFTEKCVAFTEKYEFLETECKL